MVKNKNSGAALFGLKSLNISESLEKLCPFSVPQFPHVENGEDG